MLDTDNGPDGMLMVDNAPLYSLLGIESTKAALRPGGMLAYWSVGDHRRFANTLRQSRLHVESLRVRAHETAGPMHTLYVATSGKQ